MKELNEFGKLKEDEFKELMISIDSRVIRMQVFELYGLPWGLDAGI